MDVRIVDLLTQMCKESSMSCKPKVTFDTNTTSEWVSEPKSGFSQINALRTCEYERKKEGHESWVTAPHIITLVEEHDVAVDIENKMFLLLNEGGLAHTTGHDPCTNQKVLTIHTVWELNGILQPVETLLDTGCNIAAIELDFVKSINTRSELQIQIGSLPKTINLQTAASNTIAACGKVQVSSGLEAHQSLTASWSSQNYRIE